MTTLVTGARGSVGRAVLSGLLAAGVPAAELRGAGRDPQVLALPEGVTPVRVDLTDPAGLAPALEGVDQVFLYTSHADAEGVAAALRTAGVGHVVLLSSAGAETPGSGALGDSHLGEEEALDRSGPPTTALRPGAFATNALSWADEIREAGTVSLPYPNAHTTPIDERDIADAAVAVLTGAAARGAPISLSGPESLTFADQVDILARELGRDLRLVELTPAQARERSGMPSFVADSLYALWAACDGVPQPVHDVERITGRPGRSFARWVRDHAAAFTGAGTRG